MIFTATRGKAFKEEFSFKNAQGKAVTVPSGDFCLCLERGGVVREYNNLRISRNAIHWIMTAEETQGLEYSTMYFTLSWNDTELARGVLRVN